MSSIIADNAQSYIVTLSLTARLISRFDSLDSADDIPMAQTTDDENNKTADEKKDLAPELLVVDDDDYEQQHHHLDDNDPNAKLRAEAAVWERDIFPSVRVIGGKTKTI